jgi:hypothetical protein
MCDKQKIKFYINFAKSYMCIYKSFSVQIYNIYKNNS